MRHRRDVLDVPSLIDQSTLNWSVLDTYASAPADPEWSRQASVTPYPGGPVTRWIRTRN